MFKCLRS